MSKDKFPGLDAIRQRKKDRIAAGLPPKPPGRPARARTLDELAALSPSDRQRILRAHHITIGPDEDGKPRVQLTPRAGGLTVEVIGDIVKGLASGATLHEVCQGLGIGRSVIDDWMAKAADPAYVAAEGGAIYEMLAESVARARAGAVVAGMTAIASGRKGWQGRAWQLERQNPAQYGPPPRKLEHSGPGGGSIRIRPMSVELPEEIPDGHPSLTQSAALAVTNGAVHGYSNGRLHLPREEDPDAAREDPDDER